MEVSMNRIIITLSLTAALIVAASSSTFAADQMHGSMMHGSMMHGSMMMPHCSSGDPAVMVNTKNHTYTMADKSHMKMMHNNGMMNKNTMMMHHMSMMCKSKADAMGAHMMSGSMHGKM